MKGGVCVYNNLIAEIAVKGISKKEICNRLNLSPGGLRKKLNGGSFTVEEAFKIKQHFFPNADLNHLFARSVSPRNATTHKS